MDDLNIQGEAPTLGDSLADLEGSPWGMVEWLYVGGNRATDVYKGGSSSSSSPLTTQVIESIENSLGCYNSRMIDIYNFEGIADNQNWTAAIKWCLKSGPDCLTDAVTPSKIVEVSVVELGRPP